MTDRLELTDDPAHFLEDAAAHLATDPVLTTVIATVTARLVERPAEAPYRWWAVARDEAGAVEGVAMRTAPFAPHPLYVLPMPDDAARALAQRLHARGEEVEAVNGALPAAQVVAEEAARLAGRVVSVHERVRLHELGELVMPAAPAGRLRTAVRDDADLCLAWFLDFARAAAEQAGRSDPHALEDFGLDEVVGRIDDGVIWLWEDEHGEVAHLTGANRPANGVVRIGPVYTPVERRGHGYASRAVAEVSRAHVDRGLRCCLFTDQANPVSNHVYEAIGYRPVVDMVNLLVR